MTTGRSSKQHGLHRAPRMRPKTSEAKRRNKANNRVRQQENQSAIQEARKAA